MWLQDTTTVRFHPFVWWSLIPTPTSVPWEYLAINNTKVRLQAHLQVGRSFNSFKVLTKGALENFKFEFQLNTDCERTPLLIALITKPGCDYANNSNSSSANFLKSFTDDHYQNWLGPNLFQAVEHGRSMMDPTTVQFNCPRWVLTGEINITSQTNTFQVLE